MKRLRVNTDSGYGGLSPAVRPLWVSLPVGRTANGCRGATQSNPRLGSLKE